MNYIRRKIINDVMGSPLKQKAVAFALLLKKATKDSSVIRNATIYKIQKVTAQTATKDGKRKVVSVMHYKTIKKYLEILENMQLVEMKDGNLHIKRMVASAKHRNIDISLFKIDKTKNIYNQLRDLLFLIIQAHKDFVKSLLRLRKEPTHDVDFKKVRKLCKKCCKNQNAEYKELGLSYKRIAKNIGCCARTAFNVVMDAVRRQWVKKTNRCECHEMIGVSFRDIPGYTFTTLNYGFILIPNEYSLTSAWKKSLSTDASRACTNRYGISINGKK